MGVSNINYTVDLGVKLGDAQKTLTSFNNGFQEIAKGSQGLTGKLGSISSAITTVGTSFSKIGAIGGLAFGALTKGFDLAASGAKMVGEAMIDMSSQAYLGKKAFENLGASSDIATQQMQELNTFSANTGTSLLDLTKTAGRIGTVFSRMEGIDKPFELATKTTEGLTLAIAKTGASTSEASSLVTQFSQAMTSGQLIGDEYRSLFENGLGPMLTDYAVSQGAATDKVRDFYKEAGNIQGFAQFLAGTSESKDATNQLALNVGSASGAVDFLTNAFQRSAQGSSFLKDGNTSLAGSFTATLLPAVRDAGGLFGGVMDGMKTKFTELKNEGERSGTGVNVSMKAISDGGKAMKDDIAVALKQFMTDFDNTAAGTSNNGDRMGSIFKNISGIIKDLNPVFQILGGVVGSVFQGILIVIDGFLATVKTITGILSPIFGSIKDIVTGSINAVTQVIGGLVDVIKGVMGWFADLGKAVANAMGHKASATDLSNTVKATTSGANGKNSASLGGGSIIVNFSQSTMRTQVMNTLVRAGVV